MLVTCVTDRPPAVIAPDEAGGSDAGGAGVTREDDGRYSVHADRGQEHRGRPAEDTPRGA